MERLKWVGLYPQRQGGDAFMMRVKVPGGVLTAAQAREIGIAAEAFGEGPDDSPVFGNRYADITTRQTIQLHWLRIGDIPRIWQRFGGRRADHGQACGDSARNVSGCPVAGVDADEVVDSLPVARAISAFFTGNREYANLPRKFKITVTGCLEDCARVEINDIGLWPARADDGTVGFNVLAGGGLSDGERMASDIDVFVQPDQAVELTRAIAQLFGELGNRENRGLARMRYLVQELGPEGFRAELAPRARFELAPGRRGAHRRATGATTWACTPRSQAGLFYVGCTVPVGRLHGIDLVEAARLAETYGDGTVRLGPDQNFVFSGVPEARLDALLAESLLQQYSPFPDPSPGAWSRARAASSAATRWSRPRSGPDRWARCLDAPAGAAGAEAGRPGRHLGARPDAGVIRMHFSGCSASCAQPQIADIGFRGDVAHVDQHLEEAVDIGLGGSLGPDAAFFDWVSGAVPVRPCRPPWCVWSSATGRGRAPDEPFYVWARRTPNGELRRRPRSRAGVPSMKRYRLREEMNGIPEPPGKVWFWELEAGVIDAGRCIQCGTCVAACPSNSIGVDEDTNLPELVKMCTGCSLCWDFCPRGGLRYEALWPPSTVAVEPEEPAGRPAAAGRPPPRRTPTSPSLVGRRPRASARWSTSSPCGPRPVLTASKTAGRSRPS